MPTPIHRISRLSTCVAAGTRLMHIGRSSLPALAALLIAGPALAQGTLGELLDAGGTKLAGDTFRTEIADATVSGPSRTGGSVEFVYRADGTFTGTFSSPQGRGAGVVGTWKIDEDGRVCVDFAIVATDRRDRNCGFLFKLAGAYFASESGADRDAVVLKRAVRR
jgi:hypothetical protein